MALAWCRDVQEQWSHSMCVFCNAGNVASLTEQLSTVEKLGAELTCDLQDLQQEHSEVRMPSSLLALNLLA